MPFPELRDKKVDLEKLRSIRLDSIAIPTRSGDNPGRRVWNEQNERDLPAYKRLREDGVQPPSVHGAAYREATADTVAEVEGRPE